MEKRKVRTKFKARALVTIPNGISGGGWNAQQNYLYIQAESVFEVSTNQTLSRVEEDKTCLIHTEQETVECQFESLGRLLACGAIQQVL